MNLPAFAHDMYLIPDPFTLKKGEASQILIFLLKDELVWFGSETAGLKQSTPSGEQDIPDVDDNPVLHPDQEGTWMIGYESVVNYIQIEPDIFNKYIFLEGYTNAQNAREQSGTQKTKGRERYTRYLKTILQIGEPRTENALKPIGHRIEIIPLKNPYSLHLNEDLDVRVVYEGSPLPNHKVMATYISYSDIPEDYAQTVLTDQDGIARFRINQKAIWMIRSNVMIPRVNDPNADWESFWANLTFQMK